MKGFITMVIFFLVIHIAICVPSILNIFSHPFKKRQRFIWLLVVLLVPLIGVLVFHFKYRLGWFVDKGWDPSSRSLRSMSDTNDGGDGGF